MRNIIIIVLAYVAGSAHAAESSLAGKAIQIFSKRLMNATDSLEVNGLACVLENNSDGYEKFCSGNVVGTDSTQIFSSSEEYAVFNKIIKRVRARPSTTIRYLYEPVSIFCLRRSQTCMGTLFRGVSDAIGVLGDLRKRFGGDHSTYDLADLTCRVEGRCRAQVGEALKIVEFSEIESKNLFYLLQQAGAEPSAKDPSRLDSADVQCSPRSNACSLSLKREF